ncbi:MAG: hypothetical protein IMZ62_03445 [Chloroflexi bacterium]|nr:hypothetical protein [Chloroflexota bacterium]
MNSFNGCCCSPLAPGPVTFPTAGGLTLAGTLYGNPRNSEDKGELAVHPVNSSLNKME